MQRVVPSLKPNHWLPFIVLLGLLGCRPSAAAEPVAATATPLPAATATAAATSTPAPTPTPAPAATAVSTPPLPTLLSHGDRSQRFIALTFDACQSPAHPAGYDAAIIDILTATNTPATLFLGGLWMQQHPGQTQRLAANPLFELGNHSWSHADFAALSPPEMSREIERTQALLAQFSEQPARLFRFPGGSHSEQALEVVAQHGLQAVQWDLASGDPDPNVSAADIVREVTRQAENGSIVVMHINGWGHQTAQALPTVIERLREAGYSFVTVSELPPPASPSPSLK